jgi:hypothetical protein
MNVPFPILAMLSVAFVIFPNSAIADPLGYAIDRAITELSSPSSWAKEIPKVAGVRRKGGTLIIALGFPKADSKGQPWRAWWERAACLAPETRAVVEANGGILAHVGEDPTNPPNDDTMKVHVNRGECAKLFPIWTPNHSWAPPPFAPSGFPSPAYELQVGAENITKKDAPKPSPEMEAALAVLTVLGAPVKSRETVGTSRTADKKPIRLNYKPLDEADPDHAVIIKWHETILRGDYKAWLAYASKSAEGLGLVTEEKFQQMRATTPQKLWITPKPIYNNPNGSKSFGLTGCGKATYSDFPHPVRVTRMITPVRSGYGWIVMETSALFLEADPAPCDRYVYE